MSVCLRSNHSIVVQKQTVIKKFFFVSLVKRMKIPSLRDLNLSPEESKEIAELLARAKIDH